MDLSDRMIETMEIDVEPGRVYEFKIVSFHEGGEVHKGMVFFARIRDSKGKEITSRLLQFSSSKSFVNYIYITTGTSDYPCSKEIGIQMPEKAASAELTLLNWSFLNDPGGRIELVEHPSVRLVNLGESDLKITKEINDIWTYHITVQVSNPSANHGRLAVLIVKYYDDRNAELRPLRAEHIFWSSNLNAFYRYITSDDGATSMSFEHIMHPPEGTTLCKCTLMEWNQSGISAAVSGPKEHSLDWLNSNKKKLLQEASIVDSSAPEILTKRADVADSISKSVQHELSYRSYIQSGDLTSARNESLSEHLKNPSGKTLHRLSHINSLIKSLDVDWFPVLRSSRTLSDNIDPNRIMHLFKVSYPFESTGGSIRNLNIVMSQKHAGLNPFVVTPLNYPRMFNDNDFELEEDIQGVNHIRLDIGSMETKSLTYLCNNLQLNTQMLAGIIRHQTPSIIHAASGYKGYELAVMAKALSDHFSLPWIYEVRSFHEHTWTNDDFQAKTSSHTKQRMVRENSLMQKADHIVTISESMKAAIIERGIDAEKITVVPNAVDCEKFKPKRKKARLLRTHGLRKKKVLGYISNMSRREGHEILIKAMPAIIENHPDAMLLLVGDGRERPALEKLTSECGVVDHVIFTGNVDHGLITDYYAIIDLFIVPRRRDYAADLVTPLKPYEAMAMKIPLLVSDRPALKEIIGDDRGFSFETENIEDLAGAVDECLSNPSECSKRSRHAHSWLLENRTWDLNAEVYKDLYRRVLDGYGAEIIDE